MFGLENRLVNNVDYVSKLVNEKIDWNNVSKIKTLYREKSLGFLRNI